MRRLIAVVTCHQRVYPKHDQAGHKNGEGRSNNIRNTWYKSWERIGDEIDLMFFYGRPENGQKPTPNDVFLDCGDDYYSLPEKVQKMLQWCAENGYTDILKIDDDVFCHVDRLLENFEPTDYRGYAIESDIKYASGTAYWLSQKAARKVVEAKIPAGEWREDRFVGQVMSLNNISLVHDPRYHCCHCETCKQSFPESQRITSHTADPKSMYELMEAF
jgi:hypothetical protein